MARKKPLEQPAERKVYSWLRLAELRGGTIPSMKEPELRAPRGRPPVNTGTSQTTIRVTAGEKDAIDRMRNFADMVLKRKVTQGELYGLLANIALQRLENEGRQPADFGTLEDLARFLLGEEELQ
jgi:hypothetical protein